MSKYHWHEHLRQFYRFFALAWSPKHPSLIVLNKINFKRLLSILVNARKQMMNKFHEVDSMCSIVVIQSDNKFVWHAEIGNIDIKPVHTIEWPLDMNLYQFLFCSSSSSFFPLSLFHFSFFILFIYTVSEPWFWNATNTHRTYLQFDHYWFDSIFNSETLIFVMVLYIHSSYKRITLVHGVPFVNSSDLLVWVCGFDCVREWHVRHTLTFIHIHRWRFVYIHIWKHMNTYVNMTCEPHQSSTFN